jgi:hypothetical protein
VTTTSIAWPIHFLEDSAFSETGTVLGNGQHALRVGVVAANENGLSANPGSRRRISPRVIFSVLDVGSVPPSGGVSASALMLAHLLSGSRLAYGNLDVTSCSSRLLS